MKMFVSFKNSRTFATFNAKERYITLFVGAIFAFTANSCIANVQGYQTPFTDCSTDKVSNCSLARTEGDSLSYFLLLTNIFKRKMPKNFENVNAMNNSNCIHTPCSAKTAHTSLLEILPKVEHIGMDLEGKIYNLTQTKNHLSDLFSEAIDKLPESKVKNNLYSILWQIQTIDDCIASCLTADDFYNLDNLIYYSKELLTPKNIELCTK